MFEDLNLPKIDPSTPIDDVLNMLTADGMPFATREETIRGTRHTVFINQPGSLRDVFQMVSSYGDKEFLVYRDDRMTFGEVTSKAAMLAQVLVDGFGVKRGDRVALAMRNYPEWPVAYMAIIAAGGIAVLMNAWWGEEELGWAIDDSEAMLAIADAPRAKYLRAAHPDLPIIIARDALPDGDGFHDCQKVMAGKKAGEWPSLDLGADDMAMMVYTSGSTGFPKGAMSDHRAVIGVLFNWICVGLSLRVLGRANPDPNFQPVMMVAVPFFHVTGLLPVMLVSAIIGRKLVLMHKWDVEEGFCLIEKEGVTAFTGVPTMSFEMAASPLRKNYDLSTLIDIGGGGAARPPEHVKLISEAFKGANPGIGYGLTETNALGALLSGDEYVARPTSTGKPMPPMMKIKIMDPGGNEVPSGERGEIWIKSVVNVVGYWKNPIATAEAFTDGWFHSGDVGYLDAEGYLYIVDRLKDIIIRGGENISTIEVEGILHAQAEVEDVMVLSLPCDRLGEIVGAVIVPSGDSIDNAAMLAEAAKHLAKYKLPEHIWVRDEPFPLIASGKIDRKAVRAHYHGLWEAEQEGIK